MNRLNRCFLVLVLICASFSVMAQSGFEYQKSEVKSLTPGAQVEVRNIKQVWLPQLQKIEAPASGGDSYRDFLRELKQNVGKRGTHKQSTPPVALGDADDLIVADGFDGNALGGIPNDNDMAISNDGMLISVINSSILFYDTNADSVMMEVGLMDFADTLGLTAHMYDPKVAYDPNRDRFVMVWLSGNEAATSNIVLAFSTSNNPLDEWHLYYLPGDALDGATWTDYPMIALTNDELILTGNALIDDTINTNDSWKFLFKESIIWQIGLQNGYNGDTLSYRYYSNVYYDNKPIRNLCPVKGSSGTYGPFVYLLSNRNFALTNDTIFLLKLTGTHDDVNTELELDLNFTDVPYGLAPDARQSQTHTLQTNDSRILAAVYDLGSINYVQNSILTDSARCGVYHGYINLFDGSEIIEGNIIGDYSMDFGYPNISYTGKYPYDQEFIITFLHVSVDSFAGVSAVFYNANQGYSNRASLKSGEVIMRRGFGQNQRWGDYTGSQTKYNEPGTVWMSGYWVKAGPSQFDYSHNLTWIAKLQSPDSSVIISAAEPKKPQPTVATYPNPAPERVTVAFNVGEAQVVKIDLYDNSGRLVKTFINEYLKPGDHTFGISTEPLSSGIYLLQVSGGGEAWATEKIVKP